MRNLTSEELKQVYGGHFKGCKPPEPKCKDDHKKHSGKGSGSGKGHRHFGKRHSKDKHSGHNKYC